VRSPGTDTSSVLGYMCLLAVPRPPTLEGAPWTRYVGLEVALSFQRRKIDLCVCLKSGEQNKLSLKQESPEFWQNWSIACLQSCFFMYSQERLLETTKLLFLSPSLPCFSSSLTFSFPPSLSVSWRMFTFTGAGPHHPSFSLIANGVRACQHFTRCVCSQTAYQGGKKSLAKVANAITLVQFKDRQVQLSVL